jgi:hypothetical protein
MTYLNEDLNDKKLGWKRTINQKEKKGIATIMHVRKQPGSKINLLRSDIRLKGVNVTQYKEFMADFEKIKN